MIKKAALRFYALFIGTMLILTAAAVPMNASAASEKVIHGTVDYTVDLNKSTNVFLCNNKTLGSKVGTEYFMTYTVESLSKETAVYQSGVIGTNIPDYAYPYLTTGEGLGGVYKYNSTSHNNADIMLKSGYTYFMKFTITEDGYKYSVAWANDETKHSKYIEFENVGGELTKDFTAFGLWCDAYKTGLDARLVKVRCYDKNGNDLGVKATPISKAEVSREKPFSSNIKMEHNYRIKIENGLNIAISSKKTSKCDKVYMEYTVESSKSKPYQSGVIVTASPKAGYPFTDGYMQFEQLPLEAAALDDGPLLTPGAKYLIIFDSKDDGLEVTVQKTYNGKNTLVNFPTTFGKYKKDRYLYRSLWLSGITEDEEIRVNAVLNNFKCYDEDGNNLGVQANTPAEITHFGEKEDYSGCEAMYYCDEDASLYTMYADKKIEYSDKSGIFYGTYRIEENNLTVNLEENEKRNFSYMYQYFTGENNKKYRRLHESKLIFDTGKGSKIEAQIVNLNNGFKTVQPEKPTLEGSEFEGWYTADGKKFEFDNVLPNSVTVYAKWSGARFTLLKSSAFADLFSKPLPYILGAVLILLVAVIFVVRISIKGKKLEK